MRIYNAEKNKLMKTAAAEKAHPEAFGETNCFLKIETIDRINPTKSTRVAMTLKPLTVSIP